MTYEKNNEISVKNNVIESRHLHISISVSCRPYVRPFLIFGNSTLFSGIPLLNVISIELTEFPKFRYFSIDFCYIYRIFDRFSIENDSYLSFSIEFERHISWEYPNYRVASCYFYFYSSRTRSRYINSYYRIVSALVRPKIGTIAYL